LEEAGISLSFTLRHSTVEENIFNVVADEAPLKIISLLDYDSNGDSLLLSKPDGLQIPVDLKSMRHFTEILLGGCSMRGVPMPDFHAIPEIATGT
jgi:hypothetical protein